MFLHKEKEIKNNELDLRIPTCIYESDGFLNAICKDGMGYPPEESYKDFDILIPNWKKSIGEDKFEFMILKGAGHLE